MEKTSLIDLTEDLNKIAAINNYNGLVTVQAECSINTYSNGFKNPPNIYFKCFIVNSSADKPVISIIGKSALDCCSQLRDYFNPTPKITVEDVEF